MASFELDGFAHRHPFDKWMVAWKYGCEDWRTNTMDPSCRLALSVDRMDFFPYCCIVCRRSAVHCDPVKLSRCGKCKRVHYCSRECQKKDFKKHKYICQIMHDIPLQTEVKTVKEWGTYLNIHLRDMRAVSQSFYGKDIWQTSLSLWMYQPHCQTCFSQEDLSVCETCGCVSRCNRPMCAENFHSRHTAESCESHCIRLAAYVMASQQSNYLKVSSQSRNSMPVEKSSTATPLPLSWGAYWTEKITDYEVPEALLRLPPVMATLTDSMSSIFTAMHCLQQLHNHRQQKHLEHGTVSDTNETSTLCIHFLGADVLDVFGAQTGVFEEILHWFPDVTHLELVLIGPDMQADKQGERRLVNDCMCESCRTKGCSVYLTCIRALYHEAVEQKLLSTEILPDIAMLCNSGLHEQSNFVGGSTSYASMWAPTLELLYDQHTPMAVTSYSEMECRDDWETLLTVLTSDICSRDSLEGQLVVRPTRNPFRGLLPMPDTVPHCDNSFFYNNNYYFLLANDEE